MIVQYRSQHAVRLPKAKTGNTANTYNAEKGSDDSDRSKTRDDVNVRHVVVFPRGFMVSRRTAEDVPRHQHDFPPTLAAVS